MRAPSTDTGIIGRAGLRARAWTWVAAVALAVALPPGAALALELAVADAEIGAHETVAIPVRVSDAKGLAALQMRLVFDGDAVEVIEVSPGPVLANALIDFKPNANNCSIAFAASDPVATDGDLLIVKMRRKAGAVAGSVILPENVRAWADDAAKPLRVSLRGGHVAPLSGPARFDRRLLAGALAAIVIGAAAAAFAFARRGRAASSSAIAAGAPAPASVPQTPAPGAGPHFCAACGAPLTAGATFCANCGARIAHV